MKNSYVQRVAQLAGICLLLPAISQAQTTTTVQTPKGTAVTAYIRPELTAAEITSNNNYVAQNYPAAQRLANASRRYNCHAYAWYLSPAPNSTPYWIETPGDDTYWQDGSYIQICNEWEADKVSYASDDHSAVRSTVAGNYESKWGNYPY